MSYTLWYHPLVVKDDIPKLGTTIKRRIKHAIENRLLSRPEIFGIPLRYSKKADRKLRVGDHRVIFRIVKREIRIYLIEHRSVVYKILLKRTKV